MDSSFFFRVEHDLLRSESFQKLGGSAIKVYLTIGYYSDFGTGWAYPSIRTIAKQAGLSRQTVLTAISDLCRAGYLATSKSVGRSTAYQVIRQTPRRTERPRPGRVQNAPKTGPVPFVSASASVPFSLAVGHRTGPKTFAGPSHSFDDGGRAARPEQESRTKEVHNTPGPEVTPVPGTPFQLTAEGRLLVTVDLQELLTAQGLSPKLATRLLSQKDPEAVAKVLLNAIYLESQGKLQNGPGYIRAGIEDGYELLPQVANRLESRRKMLQQELERLRDQKERALREADQVAEDEEFDAWVSQIPRSQLEDLLRQAVTLLPRPLVRRDPTLTNPLVRSKVLELAGLGDPEADTENTWDPGF